MDFSARILEAIERAETKGDTPVGIRVTLAGWDQVSCGAPFLPGSRIHGLPVELDEDMPVDARVDCVRPRAVSVSCIHCRKPLGLCDCPAGVRPPDPGEAA